MRDLIKLAGVTLGKRFVMECFTIKIVNIIFKRAQDFVRIKIYEQRNIQKDVLF